MVRYADPTLMIDGEVQADFAVNAKRLEAAFPFSRLKGGANVLIFPDLQSCNIAARVLPQLGAGEALGPILSGMAKPVHLVQRGAEVEDIVNITTIAVVDAQECGAPARVEPSRVLAETQRFGPAGYKNVAVVTRLESWYYVTFFLSAFVGRSTMHSVRVPKPTNSYAKFRNLKIVYDLSCRNLRWKRDSADCCPVSESRAMGCSLRLQRAVCAGNYDCSE